MYNSLVIGPYRSLNICHFFQGLQTNQCVSPRRFIIVVSFKSYVMGKEDKGISYGEKKCIRRFGCGVVSHIFFLCFGFRLDGLASTQGKVLLRNRGFPQVLTYFALSLSHPQECELEE